ncbi:MAG: DNA polymerase III subunit delta' [Steroidobacteraceae bacterium]
MADDSADTPPALPLDMLPWHEAARLRLEAAAASGRMPHAVLVHGPGGVGKERFAGAVAAALLCARRGDRFAACGGCPECALVRAGSHPDLHWLRPAAEKKSTGVDQVRETCEQLGMTSMRGGFRVAIVVPAQAMTTSAQNALLKTLEEPAARTLLVLVTSRPSALLPTLRSRCQRLEIACPPEQQAAGWLERETGAPVADGLLELAGGAPLRALQIAPHYGALDAQMTELLAGLLAGRGEACAAAADMIGEGLPVRLDWLERWLGRLVRGRAGSNATRFTVRGGAVLQRAAAEVNISAAFRIVDRVREVRRLLEGSAAPQLLVEALLVDVAAALGSRGVARWP